MKNIIFICLTLLVITSCNKKDDFDVYNYNGPSTTYFVDGSASTYFVSQTSGPFQIRIGSTDISESDRTYTIEIDATSTASEGVDYSLTSNSVTIPGGEYFGTVSIQGIFDGTTPTGSTLILKLTGEDAMVSNQYTLTLVQACPLEADFAGNYLIEELTPYVDGPTLATGTVIAVYKISGFEFRRGFASANYVNYCSTPKEFIFELKCGNVNIPDPGNQSNCSCGGNLYFTNATTPSTYDLADDSYFEVTFTNDAYSDCGAPAQTTYSFTKQ
jgi:hypothetical protein